MRNYVVEVLLNEQCKGKNEIQIKGNFGDICISGFQLFGIFIFVFYIYNTKVGLQMLVLLRTFS